MARDHYEENCDGCKPAILDTKTMTPLPDDDPLMVKIMHVWDGLTTEERQAYHRVMCLNSRTETDLAAVRRVVEQLR